VSNNQFSIILTRRST